MYPVEIREEPERRLIGVPHQGAYPEIGAAFHRLTALLTEQDLWSACRGTLGVYFDDPGTTPVDELRSMAAVEIDTGMAVPPGFEEFRVAAGRHAVVRLTGPYAGLPAVYSWIYGEWLPNSGLTHREAPDLELYRNDPGDVPPEALITDIFIPVV